LAYIGSKITAGQLTTLIDAVKTEFSKRANPYSKERLDTVSISMNIADTADSKITAVGQAANVMGALLQVQNKDTTSTITPGTLATLDNAYTVLSKL
jgi:hypothetical protein